MTPVASEESPRSPTPVYHSDSSNENAQGEEYKNKSYWSLPENVRHAIDLSKKKSKHSDFYSKLTSLNDKIGVYKKIFYNNAPKFEQHYNEKKRERLEQLMRKEQKELEDYLEKGSPHLRRSSARRKQ